MSKWDTTDEAAAFVATGDTRGASPELMRAIAFFATNLVEAEAIWKGVRLASRGSQRKLHYAR